MLGSRNLSDSQYLTSRIYNQEHSRQPKKKVNTTMPLNPNVEIQGERQCSRLIKNNTRKIMIGGLIRFILCSSKKKIY